METFEPILTIAATTFVTVLTQLLPVLPILLSPESSYTTIGASEQKPIQAYPIEFSKDLLINYENAFPFTVLQTKMQDEKTNN